MTDDAKHSIRTKVDIGVHSYKSIEQVDFRFKVISDVGGVVLLVNPKEQIFVEKLKSLLRFGIVSTRYKDVYDMFYLSSRVDVEVLGGYIRVFIFEDEDMLENSVTDVERRLARISSSMKFMKGMANSDNAWLDVPVETVTDTLLGFVKKM